MVAAGYLWNGRDEQMVTESRNVLQVWHSRLAPQTGILLGLHYAGLAPLRASLVARSACIPHTHSTAAAIPSARSRAAWHHKDRERVHALESQAVTVSFCLGQPRGAWTSRSRHSASCVA